MNAKSGNQPQFGNKVFVMMDSSMFNPLPMGLVNLEAKSNFEALEIKEKGTLKPESQKSRIPSKEKEFGNENKNEAKEGLSKKGNDESKGLIYSYKDEEDEKNFEHLYSKVIYFSMLKFYFISIK